MVVWVGSWVYSKEIAERGGKEEQNGGWRKLRRETRGGDRQMRELGTEERGRG